MYEHTTPIVYNCNTWRKWASFILLHLNLHLSIAVYNWVLYENGNRLFGFSVWKDTGCLLYLK